MLLALNNNRGSTVYSGRLKIEVPERKCLTEEKRGRLVTSSALLFCKR